MNAKMKTFTQLMGSINNEIEERKNEIQWYKFRVKQLTTRPSVRPH